MFQENLKLANAAPPADLTPAAAVDVLSRATAARGAGPRLERRLSDVRALLGDELAGLERSLHELSAGAIPPAGDAAVHLVARGGKRVRPLALMLSAACFGPISQLARELAVVVELVHSATLLHDDVIDEGNERRGAPTARRIWGNGISVLSGDLLLVRALEKTLVSAPELLPGLLTVLRQLVDGEIVQLRGRLELDPTQATYDRILRDKTASLFAWATATGARVASAPPDAQAALGCFGEELGFAFQLVDDVLDYCGEQTGKSLLGDLAEGKLTLPLVLTLEQQPALLESLRRIQAGDLEPLTVVSAAVHGSGALERVRQRATRHTERAVDALSAIAPSPARTLLELVARELAARAT
jgi:octaprenyl-diphosphate synthase